MTYHSKIPLFKKKTGASIKLLISHWRKVLDKTLYNLLIIKFLVKFH